LQKYGVAATAAKSCGGEPRFLYIINKEKKMSEQQSNGGNSNAPKGHGPGGQTRPGANVCPAGAGKGIIGTVKGDPLRQKIRK
tara:strand:- start:7839 stop:8087 length:249 start_codon:yes stop_codon:yes gene_type:complete